MIYRYLQSSSIVMGTFKKVFFLTEVTELELLGKKKLQENSYQLFFILQPSVFKSVICRWI